MASFLKADLLIMLTDIDGLYDADPRGNPEARLIPEVREIDDALFSLAGDSGSNRGTGGMITKLQAAEMAMRNGIDMYIVNGKTPELLYDIVSGNPAGTLFCGKGRSN